MISSLSPYIQLFAAVYLTMCLDSLFLKRFWSGNHEKKVEIAWKSAGLPFWAMGPTVNAVKQNSDQEDLRMRKRGTFMFIMTVFFLILTGFEKGMARVTGEFWLSFSYIFLCYMIIVYYLLDEDIMNHWLKGYFMTFILILLYCVVAFVPPLCGFKGFFEADPAPKKVEKFSRLLGVLAKVFIIIVIAVPVMWQLFRNWLYAKFYLPYVLSEVKKRKEPYDRALSFDSDKGDDINNIEPDYRNHVLRKAVAKEANSIYDNDSPLDPLRKVFLNKINEIQFFPSFWPLLGKSWESYWHSNPLPIKRRRLFKHCNTLETLAAKRKYCEERHASYDDIYRYYEERKKDSGLRNMTGKATIWMAVIAAVVVAAVAIWFDHSGGGWSLVFIIKWVLRWLITVALLEVIVILVVQEKWRRVDKTEKKEGRPCGQPSGAEAPAEMSVQHRSETD